MKHIALRARCLHTPAAYTATGLGDRIHSAVIGWAYGQAHGTPVTLHLTADKCVGGRFWNKAKSWAEVIALFPAGSLHIHAHTVSPPTEGEWLGHLRREGFEAELYSYGDSPGKYETVEAMDVVPYLKRIPPLTAAPRDIALPEKLVTVQWDASAKSRRVSDGQKAMILARYESEGFSPVVVGGESPDERLQWSLPHVVYAMSKAAFHVGVDSAFFHLAQLFMPWERIHLYRDAGGWESHHARRARDNGSPLNLYS